MKISPLSRSLEMQVSVTFIASTYSSIFSNMASAHLILLKLFSLMSLIIFIFLKLIVFSLLYCIFLQNVILLLISNIYSSNSITYALSHSVPLNSCCLLHGVLFLCSSIKCQCFRELIISPLLFSFYIFSCINDISYSI